MVSLSDRFTAFYHSGDGTLTRPTTASELKEALADDCGDYIFIIVQALTEYSPAEAIEPVEADFYLGPNYVISCHRQRIPAIENFIHLCNRNDTALRRSPDWLLHSLLDALVDEYLPIVDAVDDTLDTLEKRVLDRP